jgi:hypothetical protein
VSVQRKKNSKKTNSCDHGPNGGLYSSWECPKLWVHGALPGEYFSVVRKKDPNKNADRTGWYIMEASQCAPAFQVLLSETDRFLRPFLHVGCRTASTARLAVQHVYGFKQQQAHIRTYVTQRQQCAAVPVPYAWAYCSLYCTGRTRQQRDITLFHSTQPMHDTCYEFPLDT